MCWKTKLLVLTCIVGLLSNSNADSQDEEEEFDYYLGRLFASADDDVDIHDMLSVSRHPKESDKNKEASFTDRWTADRDGLSDSSDAESCNSDKNALLKEQEKLDQCKEEIKKLEHTIQKNHLQLVAMEKAIRRENPLDMQVFYKRAVRHIWDSLNLEEANSILKNGDSALVRKVTVPVSRDDIGVLQQYLETENNAVEVDEFLANFLQLEASPFIEPNNFITSFVKGITSALEVGKNVETWLYVLCSGFLLLGIWAVYLFIRDIQQELRWIRVIWMMIVLVFFICCLWHWRHMHRVAESRRHAQMVKRGFTSIPDDCKPGARNTASTVWEWVKISVIGSPDICEQYFEELMIDPTEEITPGMVIAETLSKFFFQPLQHLGSESAKFISNFYSNIPYIYQVPATIFFLVVLIIVLFTLCGYGIDFPLWMGGIRPVYRPEPSNTSEVDRITKEALTQIQKDREAFMLESRNMLTSITQAAASTQGTAQPLLLMSSGILETKLEHLISQQFSNVLSQQAITNTCSTPVSPIQGQALPLDNSCVYTVTSTPVGRNSSFQTKVDSGKIHQDMEAHSKIKVTQTDTVDWKEVGARPKEITSRRITRSMSNGPSPGGSVKGIISHDDSKKLNQSRDYSGLETNSFETSDEVDNTSIGSGSFIDQVKKILEESLNSNPSDSIPLTSMNVSNAGSQEILEPEEEQELELTSSSAKFLNQVKKIMTP